jgi:signal transduction histidine kinase
MCWKVQVRLSFQSNPGLPAIQSGDSLGDAGLASDWAAGLLRPLRESGKWLGWAPTDSEWVPLRFRETCHDMRQPVAAVRILADAALTEPCLPDVTRSYLEQICTLAQSLADVVHQWLGADEHADEGAPLTDLVRLADEAAAAERVTFEGTLKVLPLADPVLIRADPVDIRRVTANLLGNATRAAGSAGAVTIEVGCDSGLAQLAVEDSGPGFGHVPEGTRLGWRIVAQSLARCGGSIKYGESGLGGVRACFWLPLAAE